LPPYSFIMRTLTILFLIFIPFASTQANFLTKVGDAVDQVFLKKTDTLSVELHSLSVSEYSLPAHWRVYQLDNTSFGTPVFLADAGPTSAPVLLLVHGLGNNGLRDWLPVIPALEKHYRVIMVDLPGFGASPSPKTKLSPTAYADLLHRIKPLFSDVPIYVAGHSMGAAVVLRYTQRYPEDIRHAALIDAAGILQRTAFIKHSATDRLPTNPDTMPNALLNYAVGFQDFSNNLIEKMLRLPDPTSLLSKSEFAWGTTLQKFPNVNAALSLTEEDFSSAIFEQKKSISILWGSEDKIAPLRTGEMLAASLPNGHLTIIDGAAHTPMLTHPKEVSDWFLNNLDSTQTTDDNITHQTKPTQNYTCEKSSGQTLEGIYGKITLDECTAILLDNVEADQLIVTNSVIEIKHSHFKNSADAMTVNNSVVMMTSSQIEGRVHLNNARVDIAGSTFTLERPFIIEAESRLVLTTNKAGKTRYLHDDVKRKATTY
jgi:pimeloyl-ACP methyl ester carboxylesterase